VGGRIGVALAMGCPGLIAVEGVVGCVVPGGILRICCGTGTGEGAWTAGACVDRIGLGREGIFAIVGVGNEMFPGAKPGPVDCFSNVIVETTPAFFIFTSPASSLMEMTSISWSRSPSPRINTGSCPGGTPCFETRKIAWRLPIKFITPSSFTLAGGVRISSCFGAVCSGFNPKAFRLVITRYGLAVAFITIAATKLVKQTVLMRNVTTRKLYVTHRLTPTESFCCAILPVFDTFMQRRSIFGIRPVMEAQTSTQLTRGMDKSEKKIKVLLADDHPVVRKGIEGCLARFPTMEVVGEATTGEQTLELAKELNPDVVLLDLNMPGPDGVLVVEQLKAQSPNTKVIILSMHVDHVTLHKLIQVGIRGYILKTASPEEIIEGIQAVVNGEIYFSKDVARLALSQYIEYTTGKPQSPLSKLTAREIQILSLIAEGFSNKEVAQKLNLSIRTIETHRERIMRKLNIHSAAGLTRFAISAGLVKLYPPADPFRAADTIRP